MGNFHAKSAEELSNPSGALPIHSVWSFHCVLENRVRQTESVCFLQETEGEPWLSISRICRQV